MILDLSRSLRDWTGAADIIEIVLREDMKRDDRAVLISCKPRLKAVLNIRAWFERGQDPETLDVGIGA